MEKLKTVSLCMIVKNEEKYLAECLNSVKDIVDEIIIIDTGSTDKTLEIAKQFKAVIKIIPWKNNFGEARTISLSYATKDWILVLDADEIFNVEDKVAFIEAINDMSFDGYYIKTLSYSGDGISRDYLVNLNHRIIKNNKTYCFEGAVHEQVKYIGPEVVEQHIKIIDVSVKHLGYLNEVVKSKNKFERNSTILNDLLKNDPQNPYYNFCLANEYNGIGEYGIAQTLYHHAYLNADFTRGYSPKLVQFRISNLVTQQKFDEALKAIDEGLQIYPLSTDLVYMRGCIEYELNCLTKAIRSFETCLKLGKPPVELEIFNSTWNVFPIMKLAKIYDDYEDNQLAIEYYLAYLKIRPEEYTILYTIAKIANRITKDQLEVADYIKQFMDMSFENNQILFIDILIRQRYYELAQTYLNQYKTDNPQFVDLQARLYFYTNQYEKALPLFQSNSQQYQKYLYVISKIMNDNIDCNLFEIFYIELEQIITKQTEGQNFQDCERALNLLLDLLNELIAVRELTLFEKFLDALNYFDSDEVLLVLAKLYEQNGFHEMAKKEIFRSIKYFDKIDRDNAKLLLKYIK